MKGRTIKDLKDLRVQGIAACYRHLGPKGPEEKSPCHHNGSAARRQTLSNLVNLANLENPAQKREGAVGNRAYG